MTLALQSAFFPTFLDSTIDELMFPSIISPAHRVHLARGNPMPQTSLSPLLSTDIVESEAGFEVHVDLPGVDPSALSVEVTKQHLTIKGETKQLLERKDEKTGRVLRSERRYGSLSRTIPIPKGADVDEASSSLQNGVLRVTFPKLATVKPEGPRKLTINTATPAEANMREYLQQAAASSPPPAPAAAGEV